jgi:redox-sensitive bicupin YhaK (pirin superfamily)
MKIAKTACMSMISAQTKLKVVKKVLPPVTPHWVGDGLKVYPIFGNVAFTNKISPFLMFDYGAPKSFQPTSERLGVGMHPHHGMETVTIALEGEIEHHDSLGNRGVIGPGEVQWMTAGHGIIHEEYHSTNFAQTGGVLEMCQIWVNLPAKDKLTPPKYQPILKNEIPEVVLPNGAGWVKVISGNFKGTKGPASTFSPVNLWQVKLEPKVEIDLTTKDGHNTLVFCRSGSVKVAGADLMPSQIVLLSTQGDGVRLRSGEEISDLMILDGQPLNEPIAARGPFVMNTEAELQQAIIDYRTGKMGREF